MTCTPTIRLLNGFIIVALLAPEPVIFAQSTGAQSGPEGHQHHAAENTLELFPSRDASGTSWQPIGTPMYGVQRTWRGWQVMMLGNLFAQELYEPGYIHRTGGFATHQFSSVNWGMVHTRRAIGAAGLGVRAMASAEPWTVSSCGYLNLLATGEMCEGDTIHDRQHPHDLFMELAVDYDRPLRGPLRWQVYAGLAGEPALGPTGFPHRVSAMANPVAPIAHHWLDSTHITFGLVTAGVYDRRGKAEVSFFNGREPDANRADLDLAPLDSISGRLSFLPSDRLAVQVSAARLREAEAEFAPDRRSDVNRATASITYHRPLRPEGIWATTLAYGVNSGREIIPADVVEFVTHAWLLESTATIHERHTWFGRAEIVQKPAHDLHAHEYADRVFTIGKVQAGYVRALKPWRGLAYGIGGTISVSVVPPELGPRYDGRVRPSIGVFLVVKPPRHEMPTLRTKK